MSFLKLQHKPIRNYKPYKVLFRHHKSLLKTDWEASENLEDNQEEDNSEEDNWEEDDQAVKLCLFKREPKGT